MATLSGIDHVHVYVTDRQRAAAWFADVLGLKIIESLRSWATDGGPLTIGDDADTIHVALFERAEFTPTTAIAFGADAENFLAWKRLLEDRGILDRCSDHDLAWSLYFRDPFDNVYEITSYEHAAIAAAIDDGAGR